MAAGGLGALWLWGRGGRRFDGQTVLITGASRGLGLALAREFADRGARLALCSRDEEDLAQVREEFEARGTEVLIERCDVADRAAVQGCVQQAIDRFGGVDVLVNNAGIIQVGPLSTMTPARYREALDVMLWGLIHTTDAALPSMRARGDGHILNITSIGGLVSVPHLLPYSVAKFAAVGYSTGLATELAREGIAVTTAAPGLMRTGSFLHALFQGRRELEMQWFALGSTLPLISMNAARAARILVDACARRRRFVTVGMPAKALRLAAALAPEGTYRLLGVVDQLLPQAEAGHGKRPEPGWKHRTGLARSFLTALGDQAARRFGQVPLDRPHAPAS